MYKMTIEPYKHTGWAGTPYYPCRPNNATHWAVCIQGKPLEYFPSKQEAEDALERVQGEFKYVFKQGEA